MQVNRHGLMVFWSLAAFSAAPVVLIAVTNEWRIRALGDFAHRWLLMFFFYNQDLPKSFSALGYWEQIITEFFAAWAALLVVAAGSLSMAWHWLYAELWKGVQQRLRESWPNGYDFEAYGKLRALSEQVESVLRKRARASEPFIACWKLVGLVFNLPLGVVLVSGVLLGLGFLLAMVYVPQFFGFLLAIALVSVVVAVIRAAYQLLTGGIELSEVKWLVAYLGGIALVFWGLFNLPPVALLNLPAVAMALIVAAFCVTQGHCGFGSFDVTRDDVYREAQIQSDVQSQSRY